MTETAPDRENTLVMTLDHGTVVIRLRPDPGRRECDIIPG